MSTKQENAEVCEACGCAGEMGFIIKEGDDLAEVVIRADNKNSFQELKPRKRAEWCTTK